MLFVAAALFFDTQVFAVRDEAIWEEGGENPSKLQVFIPGLHTTTGRVTGDTSFVVI